MKILVLTSEPITAGQLREALPPEYGGADPGEVMIVAPAWHSSPLRFWISDADEAIARARSVEEQSVAQLQDEGVAARGDTGEGDPEQAIEDALATFAADRVLVFTHGEDGFYREDPDPEALGHRFGVPVERVQL